jgi:transglutaminase-like putative cysteine protease
MLCGMAWRYNPYQLDFRPAMMTASALLQRSDGHCVEKATLYAALCRAVGIPSRLRFANVRNHIGTARLEEFLGSNLLVFHGMAEVELEGRWVKATPAFNKELCVHLGVQPLEFDGQEDSVFQEYDPQAGRFMQYEHDYGSFDDLPRDLMISSIKAHYGHLFDAERIAAFGMAVHL